MVLRNSGRRFAEPRADGEASRQGAPRPPGRAAGSGPFLSAEALGSCRGGRARIRAACVVAAAVGPSPPLVRLATAPWGTSGTEGCRAARSARVQARAGGRPGPCEGRGARRGLRGGADT